MSINSNLNTPLLINLPSVKLWPCQSWNFKVISETLRSKLFSCRLSEKSCVQKMETQYVYEMITIKQFWEWLEGQSHDGPLIRYPREKYSCYIDYKYMKDMFSEEPHFLHQVQWKDLGLPEFDGHDSTIWLGSEGANTPGHQDSYGFNLVAQITGRKLWILFPPEDSLCLYPTRIPYEESSVFTQVNLRKPDITKHPKFQLSHPIVVMLNPGQVLYVPKHWWHYVESLQPSISINVWVPLDSDCHSHLSEAITRCLFTGLVSSLDFSDTHEQTSSWLNPNESLDSMKISVNYLKTSLELLTEKKTKGYQGSNGGEDIRKKDLIFSNSDYSVISPEEIKTSPLNENEASDSSTLTGEKNYLQFVCDKLQEMTVKQGSSPFYLGNDSQGIDKQMSPSSSFGVKRMKLSADDAYEYEESASHVGTGDDHNIGTVYSITPCSIQSYLMFVQQLCKSSHCPCQGQYSEPSHWTLAQPDDRENVESLKPIESSAEDKSIHCSDNLLQPQCYVHDGPGHLRDSRLTSLSQQEMAENLLASVLHPDVVQLITEKFLDICELSQKNNLPK